MNKYFYIFTLIFCLVTKATAQNDCTEAIIVCGNSGSDGLTVNGLGTQELFGLTCGSSENNSIWLKLNITTGGTLTFTLTPGNTAITEDFDFFIFGPNRACNNLAQAIRCSTTNPLASGEPNNLTGLNTTETDISEGPGEDGNSFLKELTVQSGESYFLVIDRPVGNSDFSIAWGGTAKFNSPPVLNIPQGSGIDITECDKDNIQDSLTQFDLTQNSPIIIGDQTDVTVTYYTDSNDAIIAENPIPNPENFSNTENPQTVYARITNIHTGCFNFIDFKLEVKAFTNPLDQAAYCDNTFGDGDDSNGKITFDFNQVTSDIFSGQDISAFTINYYLSEQDALDNSGALPQFYINTIPDQQGVFIKVTNNEGCFIIKEIQLIVKPLPAKKTVTLVQCDTELNPDGLTLFNLSQATADFTNGDPNLSVLYFETAADEQNNHNALVNYDNTSNPQDLVVRITNATTNCYRLCTLTLNVNITPSEEKTIEECDLLGIENGFTNFNLNETNFTLSPTGIVTYYLSLQDAILEQNPITNTTSYANLLPYHDIIYARIEEDNNCAGISLVNLIVNKLPNIDTESDGNDYVCSNLPEHYIKIDAALLADSNSDFNYIWYLNGNLIPPATYSIHVNQPGTYTVEVVSMKGCSKTRTIVVHPSNIATIALIDIKDITVNNTDNTVTINLTPGSIGDYEYSIDEPFGPFQSSNFFEHVRPGFRTVFIKDKNGCGIISKIIAVLGVPPFFTPNGDGINDIWRIEGANAMHNNNSNVYIFDRHGKLIKEIAARNTDGWDGTLNGTALPADDYWYVVHLEDGRVTKGHFTLKR